MRKYLFYGMSVILSTLMMTTICKAEPIVVVEQEKDSLSVLTDSVRNNSKDILRLNIGPSWIVSEIETYAGVYKRKRGFTLSADYLHFWQSGFGIGVNYMYFTTSFKEGFDVNIHYLGPCVAYGINIGDKLRWDISSGFGYAYYGESATGNINGVSLDLSAGEGCFGGILQTGIDYKVSKNVSIGFKINGLIMSMEKPEGYNIDKYDFYGIKRIDALCGISIYI